MCRNRKCLCRSCFNVCGKCTSCKNKIESCEDYAEFMQMSFFEQNKSTCKSSTPRYSLEHYGIKKDRYRQLKDYIRSGKYDDIASQAAHRANEIIAEHILLSVKKNKSYDAIMVKWELKEIEQIPYCRTDFYGIMSYFYHLFDLEVRRIGK